MASLYVRTKVRDWLNMGTVKHYDSTNLEINPSESMWLTAEWMYANRVADDYCGNHLEDGTFTVAFFGRPGIGDGELLASAEADMELLMERVDTSGRLVLLDYSPPIDFRENEFYVAEFMVNYEFRS